MLRKVVFLDRDGVINQDRADYVKRLEEFEFLPGSREALRRLAQHGFAVIVVTNQSGLHRGLLTAQTLEEIHRHLRREAEAAGGMILDIFFCPHLPAEGCECRKPKPGLMEAARRTYDVDFSSAVMVGDSAKDIECALNAGLRAAVLVKTGNGELALKELEARGRPPDFVAPDLEQATEWIIRHQAFQADGG